jgi:hypothetical protein
LVACCVGAMKRVMKRALADRAKLDLPNRPTATHAESRTNHITTTPISNKRPRRETSSQQLASEQDNDTTSAFYLQHQNRALAVELKSLQSQVRDLTQEREYRRISCLQAVQALHSLQATWTSLETALGQEPPPPLVPAVTSSSPLVPSSTVGSTDETAVEWTVALHSALQALGTNNKYDHDRFGDTAEGDGAGTAEDHHHHSATATSSSLQHQGDMELGELAANITGRANCLQEWLWQMLRATKTNTLSEQNNETNEDDDLSSLKGNRMEMEQKVERLQAQLAELTQSRDDFLSKERRLRRNIYRLDVGMLSQSQLIQSVVGSGESNTEDPERLAAQKESILKRGSSSSNGVKPEDAASSNHAAAAANDDYSTVSAKVVLDLQRELEETRNEVTNRDNSIEEVGGITSWGGVMKW